MPMPRTTLAFLCCAALLGAGALLVPLAAQAPAGIARPSGAPGGTPAKAWTVPRTAEGTPDLQGNWTNATVTPLERQPGQPPLHSKEAVAGIEKGVRDRIERLAKPGAPNREAPPQGGDGSTGAAGNVGGYNNFWIDAGERVAVVNGEYRTSLIVDPPDGRIPALTEAGRARQAERVKRFQQFAEYDNPENRPLAERCIASFGSNAGPPMLPNYFYNNNYTIVQTRDHVLVMTEMVHDARVIRLGKQHQHPPAHVRPWWGDSIGWWEGDTLVIETTNFHPQQVFRGASDTLKVVERLSRVDADTLLYKFTIDDPQTFSRPWSGEVPFEKLDELIYEYACHEGNYALMNVLSGERSQEKARAAAKKSPQDRQ
jgi:hypothetical protein